MGYSQAQKERTHKRIVAIASKRFREKGLAGLGIADLMKEAGLTVGGFYKHFDSRDELVAEALSDAFGTWQRQKEAAESSGKPLSFEKLIDDYVSDVHRKNPGAGCAFSPLAPETLAVISDRALTSDQVGDLELLEGCCQVGRAARSNDFDFPQLVGAMRWPVPYRMRCFLARREDGEPLRLRLSDKEGLRCIVSIKLASPPSTKVSIPRRNWSHRTPEKHLF